MKVILIASVWPQPHASAAGVRDQNLIESFLRARWQVGLVSPSVPDGNERNEIEKLGIFTEHLRPNDPRFDEWISKQIPDVVVFDRSIMEEQFGWRVRQHCPEALRVVDTQDLHFLRFARQKALESGVALSKLFDPSLEVLQSAILNPEGASESSDIRIRIQRELASVYRSDLTWVVSDFELQLLRQCFEIPERMVALSRFSYPHPSSSALEGFEGREGFVFLGGFRHAPNLDAVKWLSTSIWPKIRAQIPNAELNIYGSYPPREVMALDRPKEGLFVRGQITDLRDVFLKARVNLASLRFGAGIKGKLTDGWSWGVPSVGTPIAAEGMTGGLGFPGSVGYSEEEFVKCAVELYRDPLIWSRARHQGFRVIQELYSEKVFDGSLHQSLLNSIQNKAKIRQANWVGQILWQQQHRSTEYFSRWIELKEKFQ